MLPQPHHEQPHRQLPLRPRSGPRRHHVLAMALMATAAFVAAPSVAPAAELVAPAEFVGAKSRVTVANAEIAYHESGNPDGRPIVFVHGLPFSSAIWRNVVTGLDQEAYRLIAPDLVGFGDSTGTGYGVGEQVDHLAELVAALELEDIILVGHDWGAGIALTYAGSNPDNVAGFTSMEGAMPPVYPRPAYDEMPERIAGMFRSMREEDAERNVLENNLWLDTIMPTMSENPLPDAVVAEYQRPFPDAESRRPILEMSRTLPIGGEPADVVEAYERGVDWYTSSDTPKLVLYAEPGRLYGEELAQWSAENAPNTTITNVGPGRHTLQEEGPEAVAEGLADWLATLPPPAS